MSRIPERRPLDFYLAKKYPFTVHPADEGGYAAEISELPGCFAEAESLEQLAAHIEQARRAWMEGAYEEGLDIPLPPAEEEYSGRFLLRLPKGVHRRLAAEASREGVSLNQLLVSLLSTRVTQREVVLAVERVAEALIAQGKEATSVYAYTPCVWQPPTPNWQTLPPSRASAPGGVREVAA